MVQKLLGCLKSVVVAFACCAYFSQEERFCEYTFPFLSELFLTGKVLMEICVIGIDPELLWEAVLCRLDFGQII